MVVGGDIKGEQFNVARDSHGQPGQAKALHGESLEFSSYASTLHALYFLVPQLLNLILLHLVGGSSIHFLSLFRNSLAAWSERSSSWQQNRGAAHAVRMEH